MPFPDDTLPLRTPRDSCDVRLVRLSADGRRLVSDGVRLNLVGVSGWSAVVRAGQRPPAAEGWDRYSEEEGSGRRRRRGAGREEKGREDRREVRGGKVREKREGGAKRAVLFDTDSHPDIRLVPTFWR